MSNRETTGSQVAMLLVEQVVVSSPEMRLLAAAGIEHGTQVDAHAGGVTRPPATIDHEWLGQQRGEEPREGQSCHEDQGGVEGGAKQRAFLWAFGRRLMIGHQST